MQGLPGNDLFLLDNYRFFSGQLDDVAPLQLPSPSGLHLLVDQGLSALDADFRFKAVLDLVGQF